MRKAGFLSILFAVALLAVAVIAEAQQPTKVSKIGWLSDRSASARPGLELFRRELRALGYIEGKNIAIEYRSAENKLDRLPALADELVRLKVDVSSPPRRMQPKRPKRDQDDPYRFCLGLSGSCCGRAG